MRISGDAPRVARRPALSDRNPVKLSDFRALTFDCYGTLIDWESGILAGLRPLAARAGGALSDDAILEAFARHEAAQEAETPDMIYSRLLSVVHSRIAQGVGRREHAGGGRALRRVGARLAGLPGFGRGARVPQAALQARHPLQCRSRELQGQQQAPRRRIRLDRHRTGCRLVQAVAAEFRAA